MDIDIDDVFDIAQCERIPKANFQELAHELVFETSSMKDMLHKVGITERTFIKYMTRSDKFTNFVEKSRKIKIQVILNELLEIDQQLKALQYKDEATNRAASSFQNKKAYHDIRVVETRARVLTKTLEVLMLVTEPKQKNMQGGNGTTNVQINVADVNKFKEILGKIE
jgi:hypothetical protein